MAIICIGIRQNRKRTCKQDAILQLCTRSIRLLVVQYNKLFNSCGVVPKSADANAAQLCTVRSALECANVYVSGEYALSNSVGYMVL